MKISLNFEAGEVMSADKVAAALRALADGLLNASKKKTTGEENEESEQETKPKAKSKSEEKRLKIQQAAKESDSGDEDDGEASESEDTDDATEESSDEGSDSEDDTPTLEAVIKGFKNYSNKHSREKAINILKKNFKVGSVRDLQESQYAKALQLVK